MIFVYIVTLVSFSCIYFYKIFYILMPPSPTPSLSFSEWVIICISFTCCDLSYPFKWGISMKLSWISNMQLYVIVSIFKTKSFVLFRGKINICRALKYYVFLERGEVIVKYLYIMEVGPIVLFNIFLPRRMKSNQMREIH